MTDKCQWVELHLEAHFSGSIDPANRDRLERHVRGCTACRAQLDEFAEVDALVSAHFTQQVARAQGRVHAPVRPLRLAGAFAAVLVAAWAVWIGGGMLRTVGQDRLGAAQQAAISALETNVPDGNVDKTEEAPDALLAKPGPVPNADAAIPVGGAPAMAGPAAPRTRFHVQDAAGYFHTLEDFSGWVLVLGVVDGDAAGVTAFERAYERYRSEANIRFLGVAPDGVDPGPVLFPTMVNRESTLLETPAGEFAIVAPDGTVHARGLLEQEALRSTIDASLPILAARAPGDEE